MDSRTPPTVGQLVSEGIFAATSRDFRTELLNVPDVVQWGHGHMDFRDLFGGRYDRWLMYELERLGENLEDWDIYTLAYDLITELERHASEASLEYEPPSLEGLGWDEFGTEGTNIWAVDTSIPIDWVPGAEGFMRRGERASWIAKQGEGKTQAAVQLALQVCDAGGKVVYWDVENDVREMAERFQPARASMKPANAVENLIYLADYPLFTDEEKLRKFIAAVDACDLLIIDSLTRVLGSLGLDENANAEVAAFTTTYTDVLSKQAGLALLILDNTGHEGTRARGAISKEALVETVYRVEGGKDVNDHDKHGTLKLTSRRSRSGKLAEWITAECGAGHYGPLVPQVGPAPTKSGPSEDEVLEKAESARLADLWIVRQMDDDGEVISQDSFAKRIGIPRAKGGARLNKLVDSEDLVVDIGARNKRTYKLVGD